MRNLAGGRPRKLSYPKIRVAASAPQPRFPPFSCTPPRKIIPSFSKLNENVTHFVAPGREKAAIENRAFTETSFLSLLLFYHRCCKEGLLLQHRRRQRGLKIHDRRWWYNLPGPNPREKDPKLRENFEGACIDLLAENRITSARKKTAENASPNSIFGGLKFGASM